MSQFPRVAELLLEFYQDSTPDPLQDFKSALSVIRQGYDSVGKMQSKKKSLAAKVPAEELRYLNSEIRDLYRDFFDRFSNGYPTESELGVFVNSIRSSTAAQYAYVCSSLISGDVSHIREALKEKLFARLSKEDQADVNSTLNSLFNLGRTGQVASFVEAKKDTLKRMFQVDSNADINRGVALNAIKTAFDAAKTDTLKSDATNMMVVLMHMEKVSEDLGKVLSSKGSKKPAT